MILAIGNILNGGTNRGRADGFDLVRGLPAFTACKGKQAKELTAFLFQVLHDHAPMKLEKCLDELTPILLNVKKGYVGDKFEKKVIVCLEDYDAVIRELLS